MQLPNDKEIERDVLGTLLRYNEHFADFSDILSPSVFYQEKYGDIYRCALDIVTSGGVTDTNSLRQYFEAHNIQSVTQQDVAEVMVRCAEGTLKQNVAILCAMYRKRKAWEIFVNASNAILNPATDLTEELESVASALAIITDSGKESDGIATLDEAINEVAQIVNENQEGKKSYLASGFDLFDSHYILRPRSLTILAAFPAVGKSALSLNIAENVARSGAPVAIYSLEMGKSEIASRALSTNAMTESGRLLNSRLTAAELQQLRDSMEGLRGLPILIDENNSADWSRMKRSVRNVVAKRGVKLVVIDYLQIFAQKGESVEASLSRCAREAKNLAMELNIAILLLSQLNRSEKHPHIRMLRGSGQIEEAADNVVLIDRPEAYPDTDAKYEGMFATASIVGTAKLILAKGRGVGTGVSIVCFNAKYTRFSDNEEPAKRERQVDMPFEPAREGEDWENIMNN